jgi:predicted Fe-Mo cluster-binding NifX family protein
MVCLTAQGRDLTAAIDPNFGRARFFLFVDVDGQLAEVVENIASAHGAGVQAAQAVSAKGANVVITVSVGPNAYGGLHAAGIEVYTGASGTVQEALTAYRAGKLERATAPTGGAHRGGRR